MILSKRTNHFQIEKRNTSCSPLIIDRLLALESIAVAEVSMSGENSANLIYRKMKKSSNTVIPVNPKRGIMDGDPCYANLKSIPGGVDGVVIVTRPIDV